MLQTIWNALRKLKTSQIIAAGFAGMILTGALILWLPFCAAKGEATTFTDAFFTSATCVCVTGLVTVTTATHWSAVGKVVILILIQFGGIGVVSLASLLFISMKKKISMRNRRVIQESYNLDTPQGMVKVVRKVVRGVLGAEAVGAVLYALYFVPEFGFRKGIVQSVFTAVSAFCNAGIDILGEDSLAAYVHSPLINLTTMGLIIAAGLGFTVWWDIWDKVKKVFQKRLSPKRMFRTLHLQSKFVLIVTTVLIFGGMFLIFLFEYDNPGTIGKMSLGDKLMASAFQSVTTRTAGFFTVDQGSLTNATYLLCLLLMIIGGSPMGTAGGIKTTTAAVLVLSVTSNIRGKQDMEFQHRKVKNGYIRSAVVVTGMCFLVLVTACVLLSWAMPKANLQDIVYELTSAVGTVGLSRGFTSNLTTAGKWIVILTMYLGRIGPITLGTAVILRSRKRTLDSHLAEEDIMIG